MTQIENLTSGVVERCRAVNLASAKLPKAPSRWRLKRSKLVELKAAITNILSDPPGYEHYITLNGLDYTNAAILQNRLTSTSICELARIPTNYFSYTPWSGLNGVGGHTNDATVGRPHGAVNEYTEAGGTNYPPGRTNWYTTDYGFDQMRAVISNMVSVKYHFLGGFGWRPVMELHNETNWGQIMVETTNATWSGAIADIEADWLDRVATTSDLERWIWDGFNAGNANVVDADTNYAGEGKSVLSMYGGFTWSFALPGYEETISPLIQEIGFSADAFTAWHGTNWFGYPGAEGATSWWERLTTTEGTSTNIFGTTVYNQSIELPDTVTNTWGAVYCVPGFEATYDAPYECWNGKGMIWVIHYDFNFK